jgi:hypothetical protein
MMVRYRRAVRGVGSRVYTTRKRLERKPPKRMRADVAFYIIQGMKRIDKHVDGQRVA